MKRDYFAIYCGSRKLNISKEVLTSNSDYFRAMFDSGMTESQKGKLRVRMDEDDMFSPKTLRRVFGFLKNLENCGRNRKAGVSFWKAKEELTNKRNKGYQRYTSSESKLCSWIKKASTEDVRHLLSAVGYFQMHGLMQQLMTCKSESMDHVLAAKVLPFALDCGMLDLHTLAFNSVVQNYIEFLRYVDSDTSAITRELSAEILTARCLGKDTPDNDLCALYRTDVEICDNGGVRCSYTLVKFSPTNDVTDSQWKAEIVDDITTDADEHVVDTVTINNYLYVVTSQYVRPNTNIRIYRYNPNYKSTKRADKHNTTNRCSMDLSAKKLYTVGSGTCTPTTTPTNKSTNQSPNICRAWCLESAVLTKHGYVTGFQATTGTAINGSHDKCGSTGIYILGARRTTQGRRTRTQNTEYLTDVDCYDPIKNQWFSKAPIRVTDHIKTGCLSALKRTQSTSIDAICVKPTTNKDGQIRVSIQKRPSDLNADYALGRSGQIHDVVSKRGTVFRDVTNLIYDPLDNSWETERHSDCNAGMGTWFQRQDPLLRNDIQNEAFYHSGSQVVARYCNESSAFRLISDKTARKGSDAVRLEVTNRRKCGEQSTKVIYNIPTPLSTNYDQNAIELSRVDNVLVNSQLAVPLLFKLRFPQSHM
uniref:uncharacterized protein LOC108949722 n=1 Tax=Ciona intestinalis TaxID=7719 RepID=UPI00089DBF92|nr:uncharacterized protein LOC108949722 [Ciona intestinalis]|eukprot:XP_018668652.1 uncharacterized protein LOC108949722 [Ciona intestinalis]